MNEKIELCGYTAEAGLNQPAGGWEEKDVTTDPSPHCLAELSREIYPDT